MTLRDLALLEGIGTVAVVAGMIVLLSFGYMVGRR